MKKLIAFVLALVMAFALCACGAKPAAQAPAAEAPAAEAPAAEAAPAEAPAEPIKLRIQVAEAETASKAIYTKKFADSVYEKTNGAVQIDVFYNSELGSLADVLEQVSNGSNIMVSTAIDQLGNFYYDFNGPAIFYAMPTKADMYNFAESDLFKEMCKGMEEQSNITVVTLSWFGAPRNIISVKPIETFEDLKGLKMRGASAAYANFFTNCGCSPEVVPWNDVYTSLNQGLIEAAEGDYSLLYTSSLYEVAPYITESEHYICPAGIYMNSDLFYSLPEEYQQIIKEEAKAAGDEYSQNDDAAAAENRQKLIDAGATIYPWPEEQVAKMAEAGAKCWDNFPELSDGLYERVQEAIKG